MGEIARKSLETFLTRIAVQAVSIGGSIVVARMLGTGGKGLFTYAMAALALIVVFNGQSPAISWQYTRLHRSPAALLRTMLRVLIAASLLLIVALVITGWLVPSQHALLFVAAAAPFALFTQSATGFFLADSDVKSVNRQLLIASILPVLIYVPVLAVMHAGVIVLLAAWISGYVASAVYTAIRLRSYARATEGDDDGPLVKEQLRYGAQIGLANVVMFLNSRIDVFLIMFVLGQSALGVYSVGIGIGEMLFQLTRPMVQASFGRIARGNRAEAIAATAACMRHSVALTLAAALVIAALTPLLVPLVYGKAFAGAVLVTELLLPGIVAYSMMGALATFFAQQLGEPKVPLFLRLGSAIICAVVTVLALPRFGIAGGAVASSVSYIITFSLGAAYFCRQTGTSPVRLFVLSRSDLHPYRSMMTYALRFTR